MKLSFKMESKKKNKDKRAYIRKELQQSTYVRAECRNGEVLTINCWLIDISRGGMAFYISKKDFAKINEAIVLYKVNHTVRSDRVRVTSFSSFLNECRYGCKFINQDEDRDVIINGIGHAV